jgi:hypothetical protein
MRRLAAARASESGLQILTLPQMAAHLAGGFTYPVTAEQTEPGIQAALEDGGFAKLDHVRQLPGMTRAVVRALRKAWDADIDLAEIQGERVHDLALIEQRVKAHLPSVAMTPRDLRNAAVARVDLAGTLLGPVLIERLSYVAPVWRPLLNALCHVVAVAWEAPGATDTAWFEGVVKPIAKPEPGVEWVRVSCAEPHHEVIEALRWVRELICSGRAKPSEIAIAAASTAAWDDHFLALAGDAGVRLHFSHGIPALSTRDGQRCAALADVLLRGLSNERVRRLVLLCLGQGCAVDRRTNSSKKLIAQDRSLGEQEQKVNKFQIHGQTPHIEYFQTDKTILELELGKTGLTPLLDRPGGEKMSHLVHKEPMKLAAIQSVRCRQIGLRELAAHRLMSSLLGSVWSTALRAVSMPATGRPSGSSSPTCTRTEAWSQ